MCAGIEVVKPVCQYTDGVKAVLQSRPVCMDVYAVCQSAEDENIWAERLQFPDERTDDILSVGGAVASAYNTDDVTAVEVGVAEIIEQDRGIGTLPEPLRIVFVVHADGQDAMLPVVFQLLFSPVSETVDVFQRLNEVCGGIREDVPDVPSVFYDGSSRTCPPV